jgi:Helix-turn-helix.
MQNKKADELNTELITLGNRIMSLIKEKGYASVYQFWIHVAGDDFSRPALEKIVRGQSDPKFSTLLKLSRLLEIKISELLDIN